MSRRAYPRYKSSGIEWLGEIPEHWKVVRFKYVLWLQRGHDLPVTEFHDGEYPVCGSNGCIGYHSQFTTKGPGVTVGRSGSVGEVNYVDTDYWAHNTALYVKEFRQAIPRYAFYLLKTLDVKYLSEGTAVGTLNRNYIHDVPIAIPLVTVQRAIAAFLDRETARMDALIEKKQRQIELLQEKRAAFISHAVTKGLNPNAKMKESGIEWLGEIPVHWEVRRLKRIASVQFSNVDKNSIDGEIAVRLCNYVDVYNNDFITNDLEFMEATATRAEIGKFNVIQGDVIITKDSESWEDIAVPAYVSEELKGVICGYHLAQIRAKSQLVDGKYLFRAFASSAINYQFRVAATGITRYGLGNYWLVNGIFFVPPLDEQRAIAAFLDCETARIDSLIAKVRNSIATLREYRTALISAAVTGKINVGRETA